MDDSLYDLFWLASPEQAAMLTPSRSTFWRWKTGRQPPPLSAVNLLRLVVNGEAVQGGTLWAGWKFHKGQLFDPSGQWHTPQTIQAWHWTAQQMTALRARENQQLRTLPANAVQFPRAGEALSIELHRRATEGEP